MREHEPRQHAHGAGPAADLTPDPLPARGGSVGAVLRTPGEPLDPDHRSRLEPRFGHDFGRIRVHRDGEAIASARALGARAFTVGRHVVLGAPRTTAVETRALLGHELAHAVQQGMAEPEQIDAGPQAGSGAAEREARAAEAGVRSGRGAIPVRLRTAPAIARQDIAAAAPPATGLRPGDRLRLTVSTADGMRVSDQVVAVGADGTLAVAFVDVRVPVADLTPAQAAIRLSQATSRAARLALVATLEPAPAAEPAEPAAAAAAAEAGADPAAPEQPRAAAAEAAVTAPEEAPGARAGREAAAARRDRVQHWIRFMQMQQRRIQELRSEEHRTEEGRRFGREQADAKQEALLRLQEWYFRHERSPEFVATDPGLLMGTFEARALRSAIEAGVAREVAERREQREWGPEAQAARDERFNAFMTLALRVRGRLGEREPYLIPVPGEGRDILVTGDPARQAVANALSDELLRWAIRHRGDADFARADPELALADIVRRGGYVQRFTEAATVPPEHESIDRHEIIPEVALRAFGEAIVGGVVVIALVGAAVGAGLLTGGAALVLLLAWAATQAGEAYLARREEIEAGHHDVSEVETLVTAAGDAAGISQLIEGITGERLGTGRRLGSVERSEQLGGGAGGVALLIGGGRVYRAGQSIGQRVRLTGRGSAPTGPEGAGRDAVIREGPVRGEPQPAAEPGAIEAALRERVPPEQRMGFDDWMAEVRRNARPGQTADDVLGRMPEPRRLEQALRQSERRTQVLQREFAEELARRRSADDPLRPILRHVEQRGPVTLRSHTRGYFRRGGGAADAAFAERIAQTRGEPVELFGDTTAGRDYPGIDGVIGEAARPLSLKRGAAAAHPNYARWAAEQAFEAAGREGYSHVEVHIDMPGQTRAAIQAAWDAPAPQAGQTVGRPVFDAAGTVGRYVIHAADGVLVIDPPLAGRPLPGVRVDQPEREPQPR